MLKAMKILALIQHHVERILQDCYLHRLWLVTCSKFILQYNTVIYTVFGRERLSLIKDNIWTLLIIFSLYSPSGTLQLISKIELYSEYLDV